MSWSGYVDNLEAGKGQCKYAAVLGKNDDSCPWAVWAESRDKSAFPAAPEEMTRYAQIVANFANDQSVMGNGVQMAGVKFACVRCEGDVLICQGKNENKDYSLVFANGAKTCIIGFNPQAEVKTQAVRDAVETIRDHLKNSGY